MSAGEQGRPPQGAGIIGSGKATGVYQFAYRRSADQDRAEPAHHPVVIVGAGPIGLSLAIDLAQRGRSTVILDDADRIGAHARDLFAERAGRQTLAPPEDAQPLPHGLADQRAELFRAGSHREQAIADALDEAHARLGGRGRGHLGGNEREHRFMLVGQLDELEGAAVLAELSPQQRHHRERRRIEP